VATEQELAPHDDEVVPYERVLWPRPWMGAFLRAISQMPVVAVAARVARVAPTTANEWRRNHEGFADAWAEAWNLGVDALEREAHTRAMLGREKTITRTRVKRVAGEVVEEDRVETTILETSDALLLALLRAKRPDVWREKGELRVTGHDGGAVQHEVVTKRAAEPRDPDRVRALAQAALETGAPVVDVEAELVSDEPA
jgi:hypothetical protein